MRKLAAAALLVAALATVLFATRDVWRAERKTARAEPERTATPEPDDAAEDAPKTGALPPPVDLATVDLDRDVHGIVVDDAGDPIAGAEVEAVSYPWRRVPTHNLADYREVVKGPSTMSASDGTFRLRLRRGELVAVRVRAEGYGALELSLVQAGERLRLVLSPAVRLVVVVRDVHGAPLEGARLRLFTLKGRTDEQLHVEGVTDADGRHAFADLPAAGSARLEALLPGYGHSGWLEVDLSAGTLDVTLEEGRTITGRVTDAETGDPIAGARVGMGWVLELSVATDGNGSYSLAGWTGAGLRDLGCDAPGYGFRLKEVGAEDVLDFALRRGGHAAGRVVDAAGEPLAGVRVSAIGTRFSARGQVISRRHATTDAEGRFRLEGLRTDLAHRLVLTKTGYGRHLSEFRPPADLGDVILLAGLSIEGVVMDGAGSPLPRTKITVRGPDPTGWNPYGDSEERRTDHLGRFRFPDLAPGGYVLKAERPGETAAEETATLADRDLLDVRVRFGGGRAFTVLVVDETGAPVEGVHLSMQHEGGAAWSTTDAEGRADFEVRGAAYLHGSLRPEHAYLAPEPIENIPEGQTEARLVLRRAGVVAGAVLGPDGEPFPDAVLKVRRNGKDLGTISCGNDGRFEGKVPVDGPFDLVFWAVMRRGPAVTFDEGAPYAGALHGVVAGTDDLSLRLDSLALDRALVVRVVDEGGIPVAGVHVSARPAPKGARSFGMTDAEGRLRLTKLPARKLKLACSSTPPGLVPPQSIEVVPEGQEVVLRCLTGVPVTGRVVRADGEPPGKVPVFGWAGTHWLGTVHTEDDGTFTFYVPRSLREPVLIQSNVWKDGKHMSAQAVLQPGDTTVELTLK